MGNILKKIHINQHNSVFIILAIMCIASLIYMPDFLRPDRLFNMLRQASSLGILTLGQLYVISGGGVDLSVASTMQMAILIIIYSFNSFGILGLIIGIISAFLLGLLVGIANGVIISKYKVQPFLTTLFVGTIITGIRLIITGVTPMGAVPEAMRFLGRDSVGIVPNAVSTFFVLSIIASIIFNRTVFGRQVISVGTNKTAAIYSGINVDSTTIKTYCVSGCTAVFASIVLSGYVGYADQWIGAGFEMDSLVAAVLGGNYLGGGRGSVLGAVGGVLVTTFILNIVILFGLEAQYKYVVKGIILIVATIIGTYNKRISE